MRTNIIHVKKLALVAIFTALGVVISPFSWFTFLETKANPTQHMINSILGVLAGPLWAALASLLIGTIRITLGVGTFFAFPGGVPGGIAVGVAYWILSRLGLKTKNRVISAFAEPLGTLAVGAPIALFLLAPILGSQGLLDLVSQNGALLAFFSFGSIWAISCIPGSGLGFAVLLALTRVGVTRENLFGEK